MKLTRRRLIRTGAAAGAAAAGAGSVVACSSSSGDPSEPESVVGATAPTASSGVPATSRGPATLGRVLLRGEPGDGGYMPVVSGPGEAHAVRTDLAARAGAGRVKRRKPLLAFVQISDVHVVDTQSPLRVEFTDRYEDAGTGAPTPGLFSAAYRPQEMLTAHVADAMVRRINRVRRGPVTGKPLAFTIQTGDNSDNSQLNEIRWNIDLLDGGTVRVDSGDPDRYEGVADDDPTSYDPHYWHPHGTPRGGVTPLPEDQGRATYGFPTVPGLLDAARRPFRAQGLKMPWYSAFGNHDGLVQGNFPRTADLDTVATGRLKIISPPAGVSQADLFGALTSNFPGFLTSMSADPAVRAVTPDPDRRLISRGDIVEQHFHTAGHPVGHGFTAANRRDRTAHYTFDRGLVRFVVLDTVNPNGQADGSLDAAQFAWLTSLLARSSRRIVVICSHHTSTTMGNVLVAAGGDVAPRVAGPDVVDLLLATPEVVAWVNGHTHTNNVRPHTSSGADGFWEITTASHIDWPQQSRLLEIVDNRDDTLSIFTTMLDHAGPADGGHRTRTSTQLASLSRELAANDWQERKNDRRGDPEDRNLELLARTPVFLRRR